MRNWPCATLSTPSGSYRTKSFLFYSLSCDFCPGHDKWLGQTQSRWKMPNQRMMINGFYLFSIFAGNSNWIVWSGQNVARKSSILDIFGLVDDTAILGIGHLDGFQRTRRNFPQTNWIDAQSSMLWCQRGVSMRRTNGQSDQQLPATVATRQPRTSRIRRPLTNAIQQTTTATTYNNNNSRKYKN